MNRFMLAQPPPVSPRSRWIAKGAIFCLFVAALPLVIRELRPCDLGSALYDGYRAVWVIAAIVGAGWAWVLSNYYARLDGNFWKQVVAMIVLVNAVIFLQSIRADGFGGAVEHQNIGHYTFVFCARPIGKERGLDLTEASRITYRSVAARGAGNRVFLKCHVPQGQVEQFLAGNARHPFYGSLKHFSVDKLPVDWNEFGPQGWWKPPQSLDRLNCYGWGDEGKAFAVYDPDQETIWISLEPKQTVVFDSK